jgi:hypothetical protein
MASYYALKGHPASSQRGIILFESTQIRWFSSQSGGVGGSGRAIAQWKPIVSKLGFKGLSDYHSNEMAVKAARQEASGPNKRATLTKHPLKKRELDNSSKPNWIKGKRQPAREKTPWIKRKRCLLFAPGDACRWEMLKSLKMMMGEN